MAQYGQRYEVRGVSNTILRYDEDKYKIDQAHIFTKDVVFTYAGEGVIYSRPEVSL